MLLLDNMDDSVITVRARTSAANLPDETDLALQQPPQRRVGPFTLDQNKGFHFRPEDGVFLFTGGVVLHYMDERSKTTTTLTAENAEYDSKTGLLTAHEGARLDRAEGSFIAQDITFNVLTNAGIVTNAIAETDYFRMRGDRIEANADGTYTVQNGTFTTCIRGRPDYQIHAKRLTISPNRYVSASGVTVYAGPTKLITLPSLRRNLNSKSDLIGATPGYNKSEGIFARLHENAYS